MKARSRFVNAESPTEGRFVLNAVVGAIAALVLGFVPLSPVLGGALAGYLQGGSRRDGTTVGAAAGAIGAVPTLLVGVLFIVTAVFGGPGGSAAITAAVFFVALLAFAALYLVGLGAVGGWLGIVVRERGAGREQADTEQSSGSGEETDDGGEHLADGDQWRAGS